MHPPGRFIADLSQLAMVLAGWIYSPSSSFSLPGLLVGIPWAHPFFFALFTEPPRRSSQKFVKPRLCERELRLEGYCEVRSTCRPGPEVERYRDDPPAPA